MKTYRPDIDGLRAIAVLLVLFNHVGIGRFSGGYIGVDVFFVISGYLISGILLRELGEGRFSLGRFYERRFRRIMPALLVMLLVTTALAYLTLFPLELTPFANSQLGAIASVSNVVLLHQNGYFDPAGKLRPLLHTWSLGVEEQFYLVFPLLLAALIRWARPYLKPILWALAAIGFAAACYCTSLNKQQAFFLAPLRAWEFLPGILLAAGAFPKLNQPWQRNAASATGLLLILWTGLRYQDTTPFPGWHALPPCLGAALILAAGETTAAGERGTSAIGQLLSIQPLRWIGVISYSLYLWHWPIQVFQTMINILVPDRVSPRLTQAAVILASLAIATLSWRFIEQPFREGTLRSRKPLYLINGTLLALLVAFGTAIVHNGGPIPQLPATQAATDFAKAFPLPAQVEWKTCYGDPGDFPGILPATSCLAHNPSPNHYLILGDSHAAHLYWGLKTAYPETHFSMLAAAGCIPLYKAPTTHEGMCDGFKDTAFNYLAQHPVDTVLLIARWSSFDTDHLQQTITWIQGHGMKVIVLGPAIEFDASLVRLLELAQREHDPDLPARHRYPGPWYEDGHMQIAAQTQWRVPYISMYDDLCDLPNALTSTCPTYGAPNTPLLWDTDHLSPAGSILFAQSIRQHNQLP